jgi:hypothetical protein
MDKRNQHSIGELKFYTAAIFDEISNADVCLCCEGSTRVERVIARVYDAERNQFAVL